MEPKVSIAPNSESTANKTFFFMIKLLVLDFFCGILSLMTVEQIVEIPADRRIALEVPRTVPVGKTILSFTPVSVGEPRPSTSAAGSVSQTASVSPKTTAEARQMAEAKAADPNRKPLSRHFGVLKDLWEGDPVEYQRNLRDEWD